MRWAVWDAGRLALLRTLPQSEMSRTVDLQRLHLTGALCVALPVGAVLGTELGLLAERTMRRGA